jgi:hypothetical protein
VFQVAFVTPAKWFHRVANCVSSAANGPARAQRDQGPEIANVGRLIFVKDVQA